MDPRDRNRAAAAARKARSGNRPFTIPNECANRIHANWRVKRYPFAARPRANVGTKGHQ